MNFRALICAGARGRASRSIARASRPRSRRPPDGAAGARAPCL